MWPLTYIAYIFPHSSNTNFHGISTYSSSTWNGTIPNTSPFYAMQQSLMHTMDTAWQLVAIMMIFIIAFGIYMFVYNVIMSSSKGVPQSVNDKSKELTNKGESCKKYEEKSTDTKPETKNNLYE
jgi:hypothetical protein